MKLSIFNRLKQYLKFIFWDKVDTMFSSSNHDLCLVTIKPRLLARIFNYISIEKHWMERYVNGNGFSTWITKMDGQLILIYAGALFHCLERAHKKNAEKMKVVPEYLLTEAKPAIVATNVEGKKIDLN